MLTLRFLLQNNYGEILVRIQSKISEYQVIIYGVHVIILSLMSLTRILINMIHEFNHQRHESTGDLQHKIMMKKKRLKYFFGSILITFVFTIINGIMLNTNLLSPWNWVCSMAMSFVIEMTTPWILHYMAFLGISIDSFTATYLLNNSSWWAQVLIWFIPGRRLRPPYPVGSCRKGAEKSPYPAGKHRNWKQFPGWNTASISSVFSVRFSGIYRKCVESRRFLPYVFDLGR